ncbi:MAG: signal peptidase I [Turicibacter sp.]|nr:signal peptidase I [Turicibacter sp.]
MKRIFTVIKKIFSYCLVILSIGMMIFTIISVNTFDQSDRNLFGYKAFIVLSDSMSATDFEAGDLVIVKNVDPQTLEVGDIISYTSQNSENYGEMVTHKIRELTTDGEGNPGFITYGTTTDTNDEEVVTYPFVQGRYELSLPKVGLFFQFLKTTPGYIICIFIPFMLLILMQGIHFVRLLRESKQEELAQIKDEREKLNLEREELLRLKQQFTQMNDMN